MAAVKVGKMPCSRPHFNYVMLCKCCSDTKGLLSQRRGAFNKTLSSNAHRRQATVAGFDASDSRGSPGRRRPCPFLMNSEC